VGSVGEWTDRGNKILTLIEVTTSVARKYLEAGSFSNTALVMNFPTANSCVEDEI